MPRKPRIPTGGTHGGGAGSDAIKRRNQASADLRAARKKLADQQAADEAAKKENK
jgi:hypothetical protein